MNPDDVVEFLDWLEAQFPVQFHFRDKARLAYDFTEQRSYRIHDEYEQRIKAARERADVTKGIGAKPPPDRSGIEFGIRGRDR